MKNLFETDIEITMEESAKASFKRWSKDLSGREDERALSIMEDETRKANMTGEELVSEYRNRTERKYKKKENARRIVEFMKTNHICEEDRKIFNKILGDHAILSKLVWVWDGSYRNNRIFYKRNSHQDKNSSAFWIQNKLYPYQKDNKGYNIYDIDSKLILNHAKNNYEVIFIDLVSDEKAFEDDLWDMDYPDYEDYDDFEEDYDIDNYEDCDYE